MGMIEIKSPLKENSSNNSLQVNFEKFRNLKKKNQEAVGSAIFSSDTEKATRKMRAFVGQGNNNKMVEGIFKSLGFSIMPAQLKTATSFDFKWVQCNHELDFKSFLEGEQIICHVKNNMIFTSKNGIQNIMNEIKEKLSKKGKKVDFYPETWRIDRVQDCRALLSLKDLDDS